MTAYERWLRDTGVDRYPPAPRHRVIQEEIQNLERVLVRRRAGVKHSPTQRDAAKAKQNAEAVEDRIIALTQQLHDEFPDLPLNTFT